MIPTELGIKKILIICTNADLAGAPLYVFNLVSGLKNNFYFYVILGSDGPVNRKLNGIGIETIIISEIKSNLSPVNDLIALKKIGSFIAKYKPDLLHAHSSKAGMLARICSLIWKIPTIYTVHGWGWRGLGMVRGSAVFLIEYLLKKIPNCRYIYVSQSVEKEAIDLLRLEKRRGKVILSGINDLASEKDIPRQHSLNMIMVARVCLAKDHDTLFKSFELSRVKSKLILCGEGTDDSSFQKRALELAPNRFIDIEFMGQRPDIPSLLQQADIFLLISNFEALPLSIIEAMSARKAVIATNVGGNSEIIKDGKNGILVSQGDVLQLSNAIQVLSDDSKRNKFADEARATYLQSFTFSRMIMEHKNFIMMGFNDG